MKLKPGIIMEGIKHFRARCYKKIINDRAETCSPTKSIISLCPHGLKCFIPFMLSQFADKYSVFVICTVMTHMSYFSSPCAFDHSLLLCARASADPSDPPALHHILGTSRETRETNM